MDITTIVLVTVLVFVAYKVGQWSMLGEILSEVAKHKETSESESGEEKIHIEKHHETYYAFGENDRFLGQGRTFTVMLESIRDRFPGKDFRIDKNPKNLTSEEVGKLIESIFEVFGKKETKNES